MTRGEYRSEYPKEKPQSSGLLRTALVVAVIGAGAAVLVARYVERLEPASHAQGAATDANDKTDKAAPAPQVMVNRNRYGQFLARGWVEGQELVFLIDTGASHVVLSPTDAKRIGLEPAFEAFTLTAQTASGEVKAAPVTLRRVSLGPIDVDDVAALVNGAPMGYSLLGLSFLNRLQAVEVRGQQMILTQ
ncbi:MAG: TIGR02281 family clan AA aspartic protease [Alphaproteobacteria bacterium]|nr:MAG: TIGR02281 family clan AA aspartic protease [Alphaproteobacteria bacterium]